MKVLVTGASGLLGRQIYNSLSQSSSFDALGLAFSRAKDPYTKIDLCDHDAVAAIFEQQRPAAVIHAAAQRSPDQNSKNPEAAEALNVSATQNLAKLCCEYDARLLYISTDYVFDGSSPPYTVDARPNPLNVYGKTKLAGEKFVLENPNGMILRIPLLYGSVEYIEESVITGLLPLLQAKQKTEIDHWAIRYPTYTCDVAIACQHLLDCTRRTPSLAGIFHWSGREAYTKYNLACLIGELSNLSCDHLIPNSEGISDTPRPRDCQLDCARLESLGLKFRTPLAKSLYKCLYPFL